MADFDGPNTPPLYDPMENMREMEQMRRGRRDKGPERDLDAPETEPVSMTADQQIRAKGYEPTVETP